VQLIRLNASWIVVVLFLALPNPSSHLRHCVDNETRRRQLDPWKIRGLCSADVRNEYLAQQTVRLAAFRKRGPRSVILTAGKRSRIFSGLFLYADAGLLLCLTTPDLRSVVL
jgi:hypothetical protein